MRKITKRSAAVIAATVVAISGGAAWAATSWFNGTGSASASSSSIKTVTATATVVGDNLWPKQNRGAAVKVSNQNDYPVLISGATLTTVSITGGDGCTQELSKISLGGVPANKVIAGKPTNAKEAAFIDAGTWPDFIRMGEADDKCAGATFTINFNLVGSVA